MLRMTDWVGGLDMLVSVLLATFKPCESHAMHREVAVTVVGLSHSHG